MDEREMRVKAQVYINKAEMQSSLAADNNGIWCSAYAGMALYWQREADRAAELAWQRVQPTWSDE